MSTNAIGIDLGTTHSCVAVCQHGKVEIIANDHGSRTTPSYVAFANDDRLVGDAAKSQASYYPEHTIYDVKRLIGRRYNDKTVQSDITCWPFTVTSEDGLPLIQVTSNGEHVTYTPEEISAMVLMKMKETAEAYLEAKVSKAVITVPAYFSDYQRQATVRAGQIAGLEVMRILNEPTAAAVAYHAIKENMTGTLLVYDLGGGTLDVSVVTVNRRSLVVNSITGNTHLGGEDFDNKLIDYYVGLFAKKHEKSIRSSTRALSRLRKECESAKKKLSFATSVTLYIDSIIDGIDFKEDLTRAKFNELNAELFTSTIEPVTEALRRANMTVNDIDKVITVGGSSRIPKIKSVLQEYFVGKEVYSSINPDEAVAYGAGVVAAILDGVNLKDMSNFIIQDVTPFSLGVEVLDHGQTMSVIIPRNSIVPTTSTGNYTTKCDNQTAVRFAIYEGEGQVIEENIYLGQCILRNIPPAPKGEPQFLVKFALDTNRTLQVTATNISTGEHVQVVIDRGQFRHRSE